MIFAAAINFLVLLNDTSITSLEGTNRHAKITFFSTYHDLWLKLLPNASNPPFFNCSFILSVT